MRISRYSPRTFGGPEEIPQQVRLRRLFPAILISSISSDTFNEILAFTQGNLQGSFAERFLSTHYLNYYIHLQCGVDGFIYDHQAFGAHTNLVVYDSISGESGTLTRTAKLYLWSHESIRPLGRVAPLQCDRCGALKAWKAIKKGKNVVHSCRGESCTNQITYEPIADAGPISNGNRGKDGIRDDRGVWWRQVL